MFTNFEHNNQVQVQFYQVGFNIRTLQAEYAPACNRYLMDLLQDALERPEVLQNHLLVHNRFGYVNASTLSKPAIERLIKSL